MAEVRGLKEIQTLLTQLPDNMQRNVLRSGNRALAKEVSERIAAGGKVPALARTVTFRENPAKRATRAFMVGLRKPWSALAHLFEFGTAPRFHKSGKSTGRMIADPFMRPPLERMSEREAEEIWSKAASRNLDRQLKKVNNL